MPVAPSFPMLLYALAIPWIITRYPDLQSRIQPAIGPVGSLTFAIAADHYAEASGNADLRSAQREAMLTKDAFPNINAARKLADSTRAHSDQGAHDHGPAPAAFACASACHVLNARYWRKIASEADSESARAASRYGSYISDEPDDIARRKPKMKSSIAFSLPIRLTPMTATCRVPPLSRVEFGIGWSGGVARDAEQRAEGVERVKPPVEAEGELVEVGL